MMTLTKCLLLLYSFWRISYSRGLPSRLWALRTSCLFLDNRLITLDGFLLCALYSSLFDDVQLLNCLFTVHRVYQRITTEFKFLRLILSWIN
jgi:hypothetical protein